MDNVKLFSFANAHNIMLIAIEIVDYWFEYIFREEAYERMMALIYG